VARHCRFKGGEDPEGWIETRSDGIAEIQLDDGFQFHETDNMSPHGVGLLLFDIELPEVCRVSEDDGVYCAMEQHRVGRKGTISIQLWINCD
jgi:hypothetical protein